MSSRSWGPGTPSAGAAAQTRGDGAGEVDRRTVGTDAPATGSARIVMGMTFMWLAAVSFALWLLFFRERDGLLLLTTLFLAGFFWSAGVFTKTFWSR